jgi:hypothetical protein
VGKSIATREFCRKRFINGMIEEKTGNGIRKNLGLSQDFSNVICDSFMFAFTYPDLTACRKRASGVCPVVCLTL